MPTLTFSMVAPQTDTRFGLAYRSRVDHQLTGDARYDKPTAVPAALANSPVFSSTSAKVDLNLPDSLSLSVFHQVNTHLALMADVTRTYWSRFKELRIRFDNGAPDSVTPENWRDVYRVAIGASYRCDDTWTLRVCQTRIASGWALALSTNAQKAPALTSATPISSRKAALNQLSSMRGNLVGSSDSQSNILSMQFTQAF